MTIPSANRIQCNWNSHTSLVRIQNNILLWKTLWECPTELHTHSTYDPSNPLLHINPKEMKTCFYQNMYANIYSSFIHNCQKMEHPSIFQLVNKLWYIPTMEYYLAKRGMNYQYTNQYGWLSNALCQVKETTLKLHSIWLHL